MIHQSRPRCGVSVATLSSAYLARNGGASAVAVAASIEASERMLRVR